MNFTEQEETKLEKLGYTVCDNLAFKDKKTLMKYEFNGGTIYSIGIEGMAVDIDGDYGWCRDWHPRNSLNELNEWI